MLDVDIAPEDRPPVGFDEVDSEQGVFASQGSLGETKRIER
jgi:hypothetical protein